MFVTASPARTSSARPSVVVEKLTSGSAAVGDGILEPIASADRARPPQGPQEDNID